MARKPNEPGQKTHLPLVSTDLQNVAPPRISKMQHLIPFCSRTCTSSSSFQIPNSKFQISKSLIPKTCVPFSGSCSLVWDTKSVIPKTQSCDSCSSNRTPLPKFLQHVYSTLTVPSSSSRSFPHCCNSWVLNSSLRELGIVFKLPGSSPSLARNQRSSHRSSLCLPPCYAGSSLLLERRSQVCLRLQLLSVEGAKSSSNYVCTLSAYISSLFWLPPNT